MVKYINLMLQAAKLVGDVTGLEMKEAGSYLPDRIQITGTAEDGRKFELELTVGERKRDS